MADNVAALLDLVCGRLDSDAEAFWNNREMKELHIILREVYNLLLKVKQNVNLNSLILRDLTDLAFDVDGLIDEHPELSISKFGQKARRIHGRSVPLLNLLREVVAGGNDESSAVSQATYSRSDETELGLPRVTRSSQTLESGSAMNEAVASSLKFLVEVDTLAMSESFETGVLRADVPFQNKDNVGRYV